MKYFILAAILALAAADPDDHDHGDYIFGSELEECLHNTFEEIKEEHFGKTMLACINNADELRHLNETLVELSCEFDKLHDLYHRVLTDANCGEDNLCKVVAVLTKVVPRSIEFYLKLYQFQENIRHLQVSPETRQCIQDELDAAKAKIYLFGECFTK